MKPEEPFLIYMGFDPSRIEVAGWIVQAALILWIVFGRLPRNGESRGEPSLGTCIGVICAAWAWRLAHLFVLTSAGFRSWMGDDGRRFLYSYYWSVDPFLLQPLPPDMGSGPGAEVPGTYVVHGSLMMLFSDPMLGSKLASAVYHVLPLVGLFLFTRVVFRSRLFACVTVLFLGPYWLHILWGSGTLTELPMTGLLLAGAAFLIESYTGRAERRARSAAIAALLLMLSTMFHLTAWIYVAGILACVGLHLLLTRAYRHRDAIIRAVILGIGSLAFCLPWMVIVKAETGGPLFFMSELAELEMFKIGGYVPWAEVIVTLLAPVSQPYRPIYAVLVLSLLGLGVASYARWSNAGRAQWLRSRLTPAALTQIQAVAVAAILGSLIAGAIGRPFWGEIFVWPPNRRVIHNFTVYPESIVFSLRFALPLMVFGVLDSLRRNDAANGRPRFVLLGVMAVFGLFELTALRGGANLTPFRTMAPLSVALVPFALRPLFERSAPVNRGVSLLYFGLLALLAGLYVVDNGQKAYERRSIETFVRNVSGSDEAAPSVSLATDMAALGAWLRGEAAHPSRLTRENWERPFRVWIAPSRKLREERGFAWDMLAHSLGHPGWLEYKDTMYDLRAETLFDGMHKKQVLLSFGPLDDSQLREIVRIGVLYLYEYLGPAGAEGSGGD
jgi:hypothetical protein